MFDAVVVVVCIVVSVWVRDHVDGQVSGVRRLASNRPGSLATWDRDLVVTAQQTLEGIRSIVAGHRAGQGGVSALSPQVDGDSVDSGLADFGQAVFIEVEPHQVSETMNGLCCCGLVRLRQ